MSWVNLLPMVTAFVAFILSILCLFAGTQTNLLGAVDIFTLYTPTVGKHKGANDFYSMHVMSHCEGVREEEKNHVKNCSKRSMLFSFNPSKVLSEETGNTSPSDLGWPRAITEDFHAFSVTSQSLGVFYCIGLGFAGLVILERLWSVILRGRGRQLSVIELVLLLLSFVMISIASIITTVIAFQFVNLINYHGEEAGVTAKYGSQFLAMTWAAAGLLMVGSVTSLADVLLCRSRVETGRGFLKSELVIGDDRSVRSRE
ncbi:SUR7/PalI family protein [Aspergillus tanneri]|uniref:Uncharacterized protein n=1 Tax=Aspergillus tanneri TaxID=1220188 RepID=A0A5M9MUL2_9EURO|nr:uncharacterized protein ATNIH1004_003265 [Aspergillus tanneri]KAA8650578.1 hypothetical protein ATNIH1004_003265 [Aspergillus tanneri]